MRSVACAIVVVLPLAGCVEFNECEGDRGALVGEAAIDLDIRKPIVRTQETPVGNLIADSLLITGRSLCAEGGFPCPDIAIQNAGGIREETACGTREQLPAGAIWEGDLVDLLPFENELVVVRLTGEDIVYALERATSQLGQIGEAGAAGYFLQVSGLAFDVDCAGQPQTLAGDQSAIEQPGARVPVESVRIRREGIETPIDLDAEYEVAVSSYIASGRDGFLSFLLRNGLDVITDGDGNVTPKMTRDQDLVRTADGTPVTDRAAVIAYIRASESIGIPVGRPSEGRITIRETCYAGRVGASDDGAP